MTENSGEKQQGGNISLRQMPQCIVSAQTLNLAKIQEAESSLSVSGFKEKKFDIVVAFLEFCYKVTLV